MTFIFVLIALFLAMNVGANNSAAEMGAACGTGSRTKKEALTLIAIFVILGAIIAGLPVLKTLGGELVPARAFREHIYVVFVVMIVSAAFDLISNRFRVSIPNSYAIVCSIAAVGFYYKNISVETTAMILKWWLLSPIAVFLTAFICGKLLHVRMTNPLNGPKMTGGTKSFLGALLTFSGCYVAFAGGANGAAKSMGPIVAAGIIDNRWGLLLGGMGIAAGALVFGRAALETADKEIVEVGFARAILIELISATALLSASFSGVPLSVSVTVTSGLIGLGCADSGFVQSARKHHLLRTGFIWLAVPFLSVVLTYFLLHGLSVILK
jgi:phosphate/sulfate permease